jgi:hypothetical protein
MTDPYQPPRDEGVPWTQTPTPLSRGVLWVLLATPPVSLFVTNLAIGWGGHSGQYGTGFLNALPVGLVALIVCQVLFSRFIRHRYRGRSLALLSLGYFVGECVIALAVWFGSCLLFVN